MSALSLGRRFVMVLVAVAVAISLAACEKNVRTASDELGCVYDSYFNHLKESLPPGSKIRTNDQDKVVSIPASNRFYNLANNATRDPLAPRFIEASDKNQTATRVEGQARFRFDKRYACEWFSKHGRRNATASGKLGFNWRGGLKNENAAPGWFHWLAENPGLTLNQVVPSALNQFDWARAYYHYPVNANALGEVPSGSSREIDTVVKLGNQVGIELTSALETNLGGSYFCGVSRTSDAQDKACPPINFQVTKIYPVDASLLKDRQEYEKTKGQLENSRRTSELADAHRAGDKKAASERIRILRRRAEQAVLQAKVDFAPCREYVIHGLDCTAAHNPLPQRPGGNITITGK